uniref:Uncharacterized protein n=1 Tax=Lutzomyia longipalpis TaxID=7200 RepID=A0A1B0CX37_LUTLO
MCIESYFPGMTVYIKFAYNSKSRTSFNTVKTLLRNQPNGLQLPTIEIQDKKKIARAKAEAAKAELLAKGIDVRDHANLLDEGDDDILF